MKQLFVKQGSVVIEDVPPPVVSPGALVVAVRYSCISAGTELNNISSSGKSIIRKVVENPKAISSALSKFKDNGVNSTSRVIKNKLEESKVLGYSLAGEVIAVGEGISDIHVGDRVGCAGNQFAYHAEFVSVPRNLTVKLPDTIGYQEASTVTLGAIALQGVRRLNPTLGETIVVIGMGILGQISAQLLQSNGCNVVGIDPLAERLDIAQELGTKKVFSSAESNLSRKIHQITACQGADGVIITASGKSDEIVSQAFNMCRKKGRVILVGDVGLHLKRSDIYRKELDFFISTSYGPGRYDESYEVGGNDYPLGYVRWTENRNMFQYLKLIAENKICIKPLITNIYKLKDAAVAYESFRGSEQKPLIALLKYDLKNKNDGENFKIRISNHITMASKVPLTVGLIGAGGFAQSVHIPNMHRLKDQFHLKTVMSARGYNAASVANQFKFEFSTTNVDDIFLDPDINCVFIATRHHLHAGLLIKALKFGKHVFVEKPLCTKPDELDKIVDILTNQENDKACPILQTGFNRRFSPHIKKTKEIINRRNSPIIINYQMNAGFIPASHWVHSPQGGGRNIGEACHIYDLFNYLIGAKYCNVSVMSINPNTSHYFRQDNFTVAISYNDGSIANLIYTALGHKKWPKEVMTVFAGNKVLKLNDYRELVITGEGKPKSYKTKRQEKGLLEELKAFSSGISKGEYKISIEDQVDAMKIAFIVDRQLK